nr:MAG TPA: hypothetical protein [Caudoviricetes sp.]
MIRFAAKQLRSSSTASLGSSKTSSRLPSSVLCHIQIKSI